MNCERLTAPKKRCNRTPTVFACGQWVCPTHDPPGDPNCTHSLTMNNRCSYCGQKGT